LNKKPVYVVLFGLFLVFLTPQLAEPATASVTNSTPVTVDGGSTTLTVAVTPAELPPADVLSDVDVTVVFHKTDGSCAAPDTGYAYHDEIVYRITSPGGTTVNLIDQGTYTGGGDVGTVTITFDDAAVAVVGGTDPVSGTFQPVGSLSALNGENPQGTWTLYLGDTAGADPLCHYSFTLDLETSAAASDVTGTKEITASNPVEGGSVTYTVILTNSSASAQLDNPGDEFTDVLPGDLILTGAIADSGTASTVGNTVSWNGSIPGSGTVTITIDATIGSGLGSSMISNQGTIYYDANGDGTNESQRLTDDPTTGGLDDPTILLLLSSIPTLSTVGIVLLVLVLATLGLAALQRQREAIG